VSNHKHRVLWLTQRSERHQQAVLESTPEALSLTILRDPPEDELLAYLAEAEILVSEREGVIDADMMEAAPKLGLIVRLGSLTYDIDLEAAQTRGIRVTHQPVQMTMMVAEHCVMMMLALLKRLSAAKSAALTGEIDHVPRRTDENTFSYNWAGLSNIQGLAGKSVALVGMGEIGVELARRLHGFRPARVLYNKRQPYPEVVEQELTIQYAGLAECYSQATVFVFLLPYSPQTEMLVDDEAFSQMPRGSIVVQAGSGSTIDEEALARAVQNGHLDGVALDTFEYEPLLPDHPLRILASRPDANVILTPHIAAATRPPDQRGRRQDFAEIMRFLQDQPLQGEISPPA
jgi:D-3-phosphoglycerate dehydrogenase